MPIIAESTYRSPLFFSNPHVQSVYPSILRKVTGVNYVRERIVTPDDDFIDVDLSLIGAERLAIVLHGLEGNSERSYVMGMVKALNKRGWDAAAVNFRGCSGESNRQVRFYHSGDTDDLQTVVSYLQATRPHTELALVGFSLGGNVVLKYLGEREDTIRSMISGAVTFSAPCDLTSGSIKLGQPANRLYMKRFLKMLREKIRMKMVLMPDRIDDKGYESIKTFKEFDDRYTAPMFGFADAHDYWKKASSKPFLPAIRVPTLLISAADDPFLAPLCYPLEEARTNPDLLLEVPRHGGHVGFVSFNHRGEYWSETRTVEFLNARKPR